MHFNIQPHTAVLTTFEGSTCGINLKDYEDVIIRYNKKQDNITVEGIKTIKDTFLIPMNPTVTEKADHSNKTSTNPVKKKDAIGEAVRTRGNIADTPHKRPFSGRKPHNKDMNTLIRQDSHTIADAYELYRQGEAAATIIKTLNGVKLSTFYSWCSTITRLLANKEVSAKALKLRQVAKILANRKSS